MANRETLPKTGALFPGTIAALYALIFVRELGKTLRDGSLYHGVIGAFFLGGALFFFWEARRQIEVYGRRSRRARGKASSRPDLDR